MEDSGNPEAITYRVKIFSRWGDVYPDRDYDAPTWKFFGKLRDAMLWAEDRIGRNGWSVDLAGDYDWKRCVVNGAWVLGPGMDAKLDRQRIWTDKTGRFYRSAVDGGLHPL